MKSSQLHTLKPFIILNYYIVRSGIDIITQNEWENLVNTDPELDWLENHEHLLDGKKVPQAKTWAIWFMDEERSTGWTIQWQKGTIIQKFNTSNAQENPMLDKLLQIAKTLDAQLQQDEPANKLSTSFTSPTSTPGSAKTSSLEIIDSTKITNVSRIKPLPPRNLYRYKNRLRTNPLIEQLILYPKENPPFLGEELQADLVAPMESNQTVHYMVEDIWLKLVAENEQTYTFLIEAGFLVFIESQIFWYKQDSKLVVDVAHVYCGKPKPKKNKLLGPQTD